MRQQSRAAGRPVSQSELGLDLKTLTQGIDCKRMPGELLRLTRTRQQLAGLSVAVGMGVKKLSHLASHRKGLDYTSFQQGILQQGSWAGEMGGRLARAGQL